MWQLHPAVHSSFPRSCCSPSFLSSASSRHLRPRILRPRIFSSEINLFSEHSFSFRYCPVSIPHPYQSSHCAALPHVPSLTQHHLVSTTIISRTPWTGSLRLMHSNKMWVTAALELPPVCPVSEDTRTIISADEAAGRGCLPPGWAWLLPEEPVNIRSKCKHSYSFPVEPTFRDQLKDIQGRKVTCKIIHWWHCL